MITIRPGHLATAVLRHLEQALSQLGVAENALALPTNGLDPQREAFTEWNNWVAKVRRTLGPTISEADFSALITSTRYWSMQAVDPASYGPALLNILGVEYAERKVALNKAKDDLHLNLKQWNIGETHMAVIDTNVLMSHCFDLPGFPWHSRLNLRSDVRIVVWIPIVVVEELDNLKLSQGTMTGDSKSPLRRTRARQALRTLRTMFDSPDTRVPAAFDGGIPRRLIEFRLLIDDPDHVRAGRADAEIIDQTASLMALTGASTLLTYDQAMVFIAKNAGVNAVLLLEDDIEGSDS